LLPEVGKRPNPFVPEVRFWINPADPFKVAEAAPAKVKLNGSDAPLENSSKFSVALPGSLRKKIASGRRCIRKDNPHITITVQVLAKERYRSGLDGRKRNQNQGEAAKAGQ